MTQNVYFFIYKKNDYKQVKPINILSKASYVTAQLAVSAHSAAGLILTSIMDVIQILVLITAIMKEIQAYTGVSYLKTSVAMQFI